jgi:hypothetical protein
MRPPFEEVETGVERRRDSLSQVRCLCAMLKQLRRKHWKPSHAEKFGKYQQEVINERFLYPEGN